MNQLIEIQYFSPVVAFVYAKKYPNIILEQYEHWQKMSFRNRCQVLGANKIINLSVPIIGGRDQRNFTHQIKIDNGQNWQVQHWRTLVSSYNKSPFFEHYAASLQSILFQPYSTLWELDLAALTWSLKQLKIPHTISYTRAFNPEANSECLDLRNKISPRKMDKILPPYHQVFGDTFVPNLSVLDLLFNLGGHANGYLETLVDLF